MKVVTKHIFNIQEYTHHALKLPYNYVDGVIINTDCDFILPLGTKCIYPINIKKNKYTKVITPIPLKFLSSKFNNSIEVKTSHLKTLGKSKLLYKHKIIYLKKHTKASNILIKKIINNTKYNFSSTIIMNLEKCNIYFLNRFIKLNYKYYIITKNISNSIREFIISKYENLKIGFTILNLNDCKPSFNNNFNGVGLKIQLFKKLNNDEYVTYDIFTCLYSNTHEDLYYIDGIKSSYSIQTIQDNVFKLNEYIKHKKKMDQSNK